MLKIGRIFRGVGLSVMAILLAHPGLAQVFGTKDYNFVKIPAVTFTGATFNVSGSIGRFGTINQVQHFYAPVQIPTGSIIDYIRLNNLNDGTPSVMTATLLFRRFNGEAGSTGVTISNTAHTGWANDGNSVPIGVEYIDLRDFELLLDVQIASSPNLQFFGWVEIGWRRAVSFTGNQDFTDVPLDHPFYQFIQALSESGITGGCGGGNYCPDSPVTRGQMAVFLAKALGLHWPN